MDVHSDGRTFARQADALEYARVESVTGSAKVPVVVFGTEIGKSDARAFVAEYPPDFAVRSYRRRKAEARRTHEVFKSSSAVRAYFDMETKRADVDDARMTECVLALVECVRAVALDVLGASATTKFETYHHLDSSRPEKRSRHVVFPYAVFENGHALRAFVLRAFDLLRRCDDVAAECVDVGVYGKKVQSMRVAYSTSYGKGAWLVPHGMDPTCATHDVDVGVFLGSLASFVVPDLAASAFKCEYAPEHVGGVGRYVAVAHHNDGNGDDEIWSDDVMSRIENGIARDVLGRKFPTSKVEFVGSRNERTTTMIFACSCKCYGDDADSGAEEEYAGCKCAVCPSRGRAHRHNRVFFIVALPQFDAARLVSARIAHDDGAGITSTTTNAPKRRCVALLRVGATYVKWKCMDGADCGLCEWSRPDDERLVDDVIARATSSSLRGGGGGCGIGDNA